MNLVLLQKDREVSLSYGVAGTPSAVLLRADGTIASPLAQGGVGSCSVVRWERRGALGGNKAWRTGTADAASRSRWQDG